MALEYLHFKVVPTIVHTDITSSNIFIEKDMKIKVGDFGLSRLLIFSGTSSTSSSSSDFLCTGPQGTPVEGECTGAIDAIAELAFQCVAADKDDRPNTKEIVTELKRIKNHTRGYRNSNVVVLELSKF
ncbi:hypothetical protein C5167_029187 [Papaver somniferum]|nr:hypothetical protein C5167_029187 [Papaver somniferum]